MNNTTLLLGILFLIGMLQLLTSCQDTATTADLVILNGNVITMDTTVTNAEAIAIKNGRIIAVGSNSDISTYMGDSTKQIDAQGQFVMPGFIEGHGHYQGLGSSLIKLNLMKTQNWNEIVSMVANKAQQTPKGEWIEGRGWHQEKWNEPLDNQVYGYPYHDALSAISSEHPVILKHASGHSLLANAKAMELANISKETPDPQGGRIIRKPNGEPLGVFEERAMDAILAAYQAYRNGLDQNALYDEWLNELRMAERECLQKGITTFQDAGSSFTDIERYKALAAAKDLNVRLWVMLRHPYDTLKNRVDDFPINNVNDWFSCKAMKSQVDGALGAYGAWLLKPYNDKPDFLGQNTTSLDELKNMAALCRDKNMQLCVHAIGDRANREVLNIFEATFGRNADYNTNRNTGHLNNNKNGQLKDRRWRIEHAQHVNIEDIPRFAELDVIASMQGVHCTSDAPFVPKRLGEMRARMEAYAWRKIIDSGAMIANGTDAPVEDVSPIASFYASVTRKVPSMEHQPFFPEQKMTRQEALASYTINNAYAAFEEDKKGSITVGKLGDIVILSNDLLKCSDEDILNTKVLYTIVGGEVKYQAQ